MRGNILPMRKFDRETKISITTNFIQNDKGQYFKQYRPLLLISFSCHLRISNIFLNRDGRK
jgi:predicted homoserine dehydrogenase-like protein